MAIPCTPLLRLLLPATTAALLLCMPPAARAQDVAGAVAQLVEATHQDDLDGMIARRQIRVAVVWDRTDYFIDRGHPYGLAWEATQALERWINQRYKRTLRRIHLVIVPVSRNELIPLLHAGRVDLAVAGLTVTPERAALIDFTEPVHRGVSEVVVSRRASPLLNDRDSLAGQTFHLRSDSHYADSLRAISNGFELTGRAPITVRTMDAHLDDEDILELVNAGVIERTVVDDYKAHLWADLLPAVRIEAATVHDNNTLAWGVRPGTPKFRRLVNEFVRTHRVGTEFGNVLAERYYGDNRWLRDPPTEAELARHEALMALLRQYAERYGFDPLLITALAYQESRLDPAARSREGAIGVMQLLPRTGRAMRVGDIRQTEPNIHAGVKYLRELADTYFGDSHTDDYNRTLLAFAAYNAGPGKIRKMQRIAEARGLDPHRWFDNVERVAAEKLGAETVTYVGNITKYYVAYRVMGERGRGVTPGM